MKITIDVREDLPMTGEKFTSGMAWIDLQIQLGNGETEFSLRGLAARWKWSKSSVARFLSKRGIESVLGHRVGHEMGHGVGQQCDSKSTSCKGAWDTKRDSARDTKRDTNISSRAQVIDDSISGDLVLFNIPPTHKQESKDSVCSAPEGAKAKRSVFIPPTLLEVQQYCFENALVMDPAEFFDHFTSNGWLVSGKAKMKDWKAAARNWARNQKRFNKAQEPQAENPAYKRPQIKYIKPEYDPNYKAK